MCLECSFTFVVNQLLRPDTELAVFRNWEAFARELGTGHGQVYQLNQQLVRETKSYSTVLHEILTDWRMNKGREATVGMLISCLETVGWRSVIGNVIILNLIRKHFFGSFVIHVTN